MKLARVSTPDGTATGTYEDGTVAVGGREYSMEGEADLLPPADPSALYCVGRNYAATLDQMDYDRPEEPDFFIKPPASLLSPGRPIPYPEFSEEVTYAGELAAVIDRHCADLSPKEAPDYVRGYTVMNDVDALDQQGRTARKAFTGSAPLGPSLETDVDPTDIEMETVIDGEVRQEATTRQMLFDPYEIVSFVSERFVLRPGDVVAFGSPANPGTIEPGDEIEITYEGVGTLHNGVARREP